MAVHNDSTAPDFTALYRELGVDATCSLGDLRAAWRRRVSKLHPDQGGNAEATGRLQELNRRYDAALAFHARFGRLPGAPASGALAPASSPVSTQTMPDAAPEHGWRRADAIHEAQGTAGFGTMARSFVAVSLVAVILMAMILMVILLGGRLLGREDSTTDGGGDAQPVAAAFPPATTLDGTVSNEAATRAADVVAPDANAAGMDKDTVRHILGDPLEMHLLRWQYGPSWVDFRCDRVAGWYSSPLHSLHTGTSRLEAPPAAETRCD
jgi:hypothetical protein